MEVARPLTGLRINSSLVPLVIAVAAVAVLAGMTYASVVERSVEQSAPKVTWRDSSGAVIASLTLSFTAPGSLSKTISFSCSPSAGSVILRFSSSFGNLVNLSQTDFPSCDSSLNSVTLSIHSTVSLNVGGTLHLTQPDKYRTLAKPLQVNVKVA